MAISGLCSFYRNSGTLIMGRPMAYCDLDCDRTTCDGDLHLCEKPDVLRKRLSDQKKKGGDLEWERRKDAHFSGSQRL